MNTVAGAVQQYQRQYGRPPASLSELPGDAVAKAATTVHYALEPTGWAAWARLRCPCSPEYPVYAVGSGPNILRDSSFDGALGSAPAGWLPLRTTRWKVVDVPAWGNTSVELDGGAGDRNGRTGFGQQQYVGAPAGTPFTASAYVRIDRLERGHLLLWVNVIYVDGTRADPLATRDLGDATGLWHRESITVVPRKPVAYIGAYIIGQGFQGSALIDGMQLVPASEALDYGHTPQGPSTVVDRYSPEALVRGSPVLGVGPRKEVQVAALDNEYLVMAARYGLAGLAVYLWVLAAVAWALVRSAGGRSARPAGARRARGEPDWQTLGAAGALGVWAAAAVFAVFAGWLLSFQLAAVTWLAAGNGLTEER